jgi:hypothetical protein
MVTTPALWVPFLVMFLVQHFTLEQNNDTQYIEYVTHSPGVVYVPCSPGCIRLPAI